MGIWGIRLAKSCIAAGALALVAACSTADGPRSASAASAPGPALWKIADEDTTIYLFGTVHALPKDVEWYAPHIASALESADELVTEVDLSDTTAMPALIAQKAGAQNGARLREQMSEDEGRAFEEALVSLGLPVESFDGFKPWFAAVTLSLVPLLNAGYDTEHGVEQVLNASVGAQVKRDHLETIEYQLDLFDTLPHDTQLAYLAQVVAAAPDLPGQLDSMVVAWLKGDAAALASLMNAQQNDPALYKRLITDRNANWAVWIGKRLEQPGTVFMAVGAGHLAGKGSVQDMLRKRRIKSVRVQ